jgi:hypothetical protein
MGYFADKITEGLVHKALKVTYADWTLFSGAVANPLTPITAAPAGTYKLNYKATNSGTVVVTGTLAGVAQVETVTLTANVLRVGSKSFDGTPSSITCTCPTGTIVITCLTTNGATIQHETTAPIDIKWSDYTKVWQDESVTSAMVEVIDSSIVEGATIKFDRTNYISPTNGKPYTVAQYRARLDPITKAYLFSILYL